MLCNRFIQFAIKYAKKDYLFISNHSEKGRKILSSLNIPVIKGVDTIYLLDNNNSDIKIKSEAALSILENCGGVLKIVSLITRIIPKFIRDFIYNIVAKNRYFFSKTTCKIPQKYRYN